MRRIQLRLKPALFFIISIFFLCHYSLSFLEFKGRSNLIYSNRNIAKHYPNHNNVTLLMRPSAPFKRKTIVMTPSWWDGRPFPYLNESTPLCPRCLFTEDQKLLKDADAVVFHAMTLRHKHFRVYKPLLMDDKRSPHQIWVMMWFEAIRPHFVEQHRLMRKRISRLDGLINWTMSYRLDSDVPTPYGRFISRRTGKRVKIPFNSENNSIHHGKTPMIEEMVKMPSLENFKDKRMVAWIVSKCHTSNNRMALASEIQKHVPIDIYGKCGNGTWKCRESWPSVDCKTQVKDQYLFYLSFENGNCQDYVTEKLFDVVNRTDMIPIVLGGGGDTYKKMFPPKSYIDVRDFKSAEHLANYLIHLSKNPEEWISYFEWRKDFWVHTNRWVSGYCDLCDKLWELDKKKNNVSESKSYEDIWEWISNEPGVTNDRGSVIKGECDIDNVEIDQIWKKARK